MNIDANGDLFGTTSLDERRHFGEFYEQLLNDPQSAGNAGEYRGGETPGGFAF